LLIFAYDTRERFQQSVTKESMKESKHLYYLLQSFNHLQNSAMPRRETGSFTLQQDGHLTDRFVSFFLF